MSFKHVKKFLAILSLLLILSSCIVFNDAESVETKEATTEETQDNQENTGTSEMTQQISKEPTAEKQQTLFTERQNHINLINSEKKVEYLYRTFIQTPECITLGPDGCVYIGDVAGRHVVKFDKDGSMTDLGLWQYIRELQHDGPKAIEFDSKGNMYIHNHGFIFYVDTEGNIERLNDICGAPIGGIELSADDVLYYTDRGGGSLYKWTRENGSELIASNLPMAEHIKFGLDGTLYLTQMGYGDLKTVDLDTGETEIFASNVCGFDPCYLAIDKEGDIWVRAIWNIYQIAPDGTIKNYIIDGKNYDEYSWHTSAGIEVDNEGIIWIASCNSRVIQFLPVSGEPDPEYILDVIFKGFEAADLDADSNGNIYATDLNDMRILKISPEGEVEIVLKHNSMARMGIAVDVNDVIYFGTYDDGYIKRIEKDGTTTNYAKVYTERMIFGADGNLYAVSLSEGGQSSIVKITGKNQVDTFVKEIDGISLGRRALMISPALDTGLYVYTEDGNNLFYVDFEGNGHLIGNYSHIGGSYATMAANPVSGEIYLRTEGGSYLYRIYPDGTYVEFTDNQYADLWGIVVSKDGKYLYTEESGAIDKIPLS